VPTLAPLTPGKDTPSPTPLKDGLAVAEKGYATVDFHDTRAYTGGAIKKDRYAYRDLRRKDPESEDSTVTR